MYVILYLWYFVDFIGNIHEVTKGNLVTVLKKWGKFFRVTAKIRLAKDYPTGGTPNIVHFTSGGDKIPKLTFSQQRFYVAGGSNHLVISDPLEGDKTYDLVIEQSIKEDGKIYFEIKVNNEVIRSLENTDAQEYDNVYVYVGSPDNEPFSAEHGRIENLEWTRLQGN